MLKEKLIKKLKNSLSTTDQNLLSLFKITEQKGLVVFRMPKTLFALDNLWTEIEKVANDSDIKIIRSGIVATVEELDSILSDIKWLWNAHIPKGFMTMYAGESGIGKSLTVLDVARIITNGDQFPLSQEKSERNKVFWIDTEMKQQLLNVRSKSLNVDRTRLLIPAIDGSLLSKVDMSNELHKQYMLNVIQSEMPALLVVDSLGHSHSRGENRIEEVRPIMDFLTALARDFDMGLIVVHHLNKPKDEATEISLSRVRGSTDIVATPVVIYAVERGGEEDTVKIRQIKNNIGRQQPALSAKLKYKDDDKEVINALEYSLHKAPPPKINKKEEVASWVREVLHKNQDGLPLTKLKQLGAEKGYSTNNLYSARNILSDQLTLSGTGNRAHWMLSTFSDHDTINQIKQRSKK